MSEQEPTWKSRLREKASLVDLGPLKQAHAVSGEEGVMAEELKTIVLYECEFCKKYLNSKEARTEHEQLEHAYSATIRDTPPCKHEWRQYMGRSVAPATSRPDGFFCIHCPAKSDENRVITNPEAL